MNLTHYIFKRNQQGFLILALIVYSTFCSAQLYYNDCDDLQSAVNSATSGGTFIVTNGTYNDFESTFENQGSAANPIIIKAESVGGVILTGESKFVFKKSAHCILEGFTFDATSDETLVKLEGCNNIRITRNVFELSTTESVKWVFIGGVWNDNTLPFQYPSHHNMIDHNLFQNKNTPGHYITVDGSHEDSGSDEVYYQSTYDIIRLNHFRNNGPRAVNEQESIRIGWSEMSPSSGYTLVEHNLFNNCDGDPEIVSVKSCDNTIRNNTFRSSYGTLSLRHGNRNTVTGNFFFGDSKPVGTSPAGSTLYTGGIRIYGTDHVILNNHFEGLNGTRWDAPITLTQGDAIDGQSTSYSKHFRAERVLIAFNTLVNNTHGIELGFDNNNNYSKDIKDIIIANNLLTASENALVDIVDVNNDPGSEVSWENNLAYPTGTAVTLGGATTTSFDTTEVKTADPYLQYNNLLKYWKSTAQTPTLNVGSSISPVPTVDIEGQNRPLLSNPGADHFSNDVILYEPLDSVDVGPQAYGQLDILYPDQDELIFHPNPADTELHVEFLTRQIEKISLYSLTGHLILQTDKTPSNTQVIETSTIPDGTYLLLMSGKDWQIFEKIVILH